MEAPENQITLDKLPTGARLIVRSRDCWRFAAVSKVVEERVVLTVASPGGHSYRIRRELTSEVFLDGSVPVLPNEEPDDWRENFGRYDSRW